MLAAGIENAALDAELLLRHVTGWDRATLLAETNAEIGDLAAARYFALVEERASRRPLQHLTGVQAFWHHEFHVTRDVLIPRPETEVLVEAALGLLRQMTNPLVVDVGTGSGCIALSLANELPNAEIHATEISLAALAVAEDNARRLGLADRVWFHLGDLLTPVADLAGRLDMIVSNPPYVDPAVSVSLAPEVRDHEPALALFPAGDAYAAYRRLAPQVMRLLRPGGRLVLEIGQDMSDGVDALCREAGLVVERIVPDLQSIPRALVASKPGPR